MGDFYDRALGELLAKADGLGVDVPDAVRVLHTSEAVQGGADYLRVHPEMEDPDRWPADFFPCCWGVAIYFDLSRCQCWEPVYADAQAAPQLVDGPADCPTQTAMCGDCAFRKDSPERSEEWTEESLLRLADTGAPFWCHDGMRVPVAFRHPVLGEVPADPAGYTPAVVAGVPYRADGTPGLLCSGWAHRASRACTTRQGVIR